MGWRLGYIRSTLRGLAHIRRLQKLNTMTEMVSAVESSAETLSPQGDRQMRALVRHWWFWRHLHPAVHKNSCLYFSMLGLAYELVNGRDVEVNVWLSTGLKRDRGHCWLTRNGEILYKQDHDSVPGEAEQLSRQGRIVYWWSNAKRPS